jgi:hypothetical protein
MKLQFALIASTLAVAFSRNLPKVKLNKGTQKKVNQILNKAATKAEGKLSNLGINADLSQSASDALDAVQPQLNQMETQLNQAFNKFASQFGSMDVGEIIDTANNNVNNAIDNAEANAPDGFKTFIDIGQDILGSLAQAGKDGLGNKADVTVNKIITSGRNAAQGAINSKGVHQTLNKANAAVNNA